MCEFQICTECANYYAQNLEKVRFIHRTYYVPFHPHPVTMNMGSESKSWVCDGTKLPGKCKTSESNDPLTETKSWGCKQCNEKYCYPCLTRQDIEDVSKNEFVHPHSLFKVSHDSVFQALDSSPCDLGKQGLGIEHQIDSEQKVLRCEECNFNSCAD